MHSEPSANDSPTTSELVVGVLGGMGPEATVDFLAKLVAATPVGREADHLRVLVDMNPKVPDRGRAVAPGEASAGTVLAAMARGLEAAGAGFVVMACNTAHVFESEIRAALSVPFVSIVAEACDACERLHPQACRIGVLAAQGCLDAKLYQDGLAARGRTAVILSDAQRREFMTLLHRIKRGDLSDDVRGAMRALGEALVVAGADLVVAACTEVPLVVRDGDLSRPLLDPTAHLAARSVRYARRLDPLPIDMLPLVTRPL